MSRYKNRGEYLFSEPSSERALFRDKIEEGKIKRSYKFKQMQRLLQNKQKPPEDFFDFFGLPKQAVVGSSAIDNAGKLWTHTKNGWETDAYDSYGVSFNIDKKLPKGKFVGQTYTAHNGIDYVYGQHGWEAKIPQQLHPKVELDAVVADYPKESWFARASKKIDVTNKSLWPQYKWDWFENNVSGYNLYGKMDGGDIGLGNSLGENSEIYGSIDTNDFGFPGPKGAKLKYWGHLSNGSSYALDAIRRASRGIKYADRVYHLLDSNTNQQELDAIRLDSIFQNEITPFIEDAFHHWGLPYAWQKDSIPYIFPTDFYPKRKDSSAVRLLIRKRTDSIKKKFKK